MKSILPLSLAVIITSANAQTSQPSICSHTIDANSFYGQVVFTTGEDESYFTALGDLDGDGKPDLAAANYSGTTITVFRNTSTGGIIAENTFAPGINYHSGARPSGIAMGDLDGDGKLDLVVTNAESNTISIFRNTTSIGVIDENSFAQKIEYETTSYPVGVAIADLDADGKLDLAVANNGGNWQTPANTVSVYKNITQANSANISFNPKLDFETGMHPLGVNVGDLDADGKPEIVVASGSNVISVLKNLSSNGVISSGSFADRVDYPAGNGSTDRVGISDLDGDGKPDLSFVNLHDNTVSVLRNVTTTGTIEPSSFAPGINFTTNSRPVGVAVSDLDGDGKLDLVVANEGTGSVSVFKNTSTVGSLTASSFAPKIDYAKAGYSYEPIVGDIDGDGRPDLIIGNGNNSVAVLQNRICDEETPSEPSICANAIDANSFSPEVLFTTGEGESYFTALGDLDGDGKPDLAAANYSGTTITVFRNTSTGGIIAENTFAPGINYHSGARPSGIAMGDLDGDGKLDLVVTNAESNTISIFRNTTSIGVIDENSFAQKIEYETTSYPVGVAIADLDADGKLDLAVANNGGNWVSVYKNITQANSANISFSPKLDFETGMHPLGVNVGDLDADGKPEIVVASGSNVISVLKNLSSNGVISSGSFADRVDYPAGNGSTDRVGIADLDGDGKPDLSFVNLHDNTVSVLRNVTTTGTIELSSFAPGINFSTNSRPLGVAVSDLDGDGKLDLVVANEGTGSVSVFKNTSTVGSLTASSFAPKIDYAKAGYSYEPIVGDIDGDGRPDLIIGNGNNSVAVLQNRICDEEAPTFTRPIDITILTDSNCGYDISVVKTGDVTNEADNFSTGLQATYTDVIVPSGSGNRVISRTWTLADHSGNRAIDQVQVITVVDQTSPVISVCAQAVTISTNHDGCTALLPDYRSFVTASDNCGALTLTQLPSAGTALPMGTNTVSIIATDASGNTSSCQFVVTVTNTLDAAFTTTNDWLYYGFSGDQTAIIKATPTGGVGPYTVTIAMNRALNCNIITSNGDEAWVNGNGTVSSSNVTCPYAGSGSGFPSATGSVSANESYELSVTLMEDAIFTATITDALGCSVKREVHIDAEDTRCFAGSSAVQKITLCHKTGSAKNPCITLCVNESAVGEHLAHGDFMGNCTTDCSAPLANARSNTDDGNDLLLNKEASIDVYPNPTRSSLSIKLSYVPNENVLMQITDATGRIMTYKEASPSPDGSYEMDTYHLLPGLYILQLKAGAFRKSIKLMKE